MVELDGYAPSHPRCGRGMLLLSSQPQSKMDARAGIAPTWDSFADCRMTPLPTRESHRQQFQVARLRKTSPQSALDD